MIELSSALVLLFLTFAPLAALRTFRRLQHNSSRLPYPPGPPPRFILGNLFDLPKARTHLILAEWSKRYNSDIVSYHVPGEHTIVINSAKAAKELFERRSTIYSDRPHFEMVYLTGWDFNITWMPYSDSWRAHRRVIHQHFRQEAVVGYYPLLTSRNKRLLRSLLADPNTAVEQMKHHTGSLSLKLAYNREASLNGDPLIQKVENAVSVLGQIVTPGIFLVNTYSFLKYFPEWVPGIKDFKDYARECKVLTTEIEYGLFNETKQNMGNGNPPNSLLAKVLDNNKDGEFGEYVIRRSFATIHIAAADTSMAALTGAIMALVHHPDVQARGQAEMDKVIGRDRLPDLADREQLPYISAICREVMRWRLIAPLAGSHATSSDDVYNGYFIPKGSTVVGNAWAILHDPEVYPDPERFLPERFITPEGKLSKDEVLASFGYGRRICPGRYLAFATLWSAVACILAVFDIVKAKDEDGNEVEVNTEYVDSGVSHPEPFECAVRPRDPKAEDLVRNLEISDSNL